MASRVVMPKLSDTMEEGRILRWLKSEGDAIETGQALAEVETDKATVEMEAYTNGTILKLIASEGQFAKVGDLIAVIGAAGEDFAALLPAAGAPAPAPAPAAAAPAPPRMPQPALPQPAAPAATGRSVKASPLALRMAAEAGLDLGSLQGTGPQGRVIKRDIEAALAQAPAAAPASVASPASTVTDTAPVADRPSDDARVPAAPEAATCPAASPAPSPVACPTAPRGRVPAATANGKAKYISSSGVASLSRRLAMSMRLTPSKDNQLSMTALASFLARFFVP